MEPSRILTRISVAIGLLITTVLVRFGIGFLLGDTTRATNVLAWVVAVLASTVAYLSFQLNELRRGTGIPVASGTLPPTMSMSKES